MPTHHRLLFHKVSVCKANTQAFSEFVRLACGLFTSTSQIFSCFPLSTKASSPQTSTQHLQPLDFIPQRTWPNYPFPISPAHYVLSASPLLPTSSAFPEGIQDLVQRSLPWLEQCVCLLNYFHIHNASPIQPCIAPVCIYMAYILLDYQSLEDRDLAHKAFCIVCCPLHIIST